MMKTVLLFGGSSDERLVSVASAQNLVQQYPFDEVWFFDQDGKVTLVGKEELAAHQDPFKNPFRSHSKPMAESLNQSLTLLKDKVAFLGFHGTEGENGTMQSALEKSGIPFTGSGSKSSYTCFEKTLAKQKVAEAKRPVADQFLVGENDKGIQEFFSRHAKIVLKPIANGSSIGLHIVSDQVSFEKAIAAIRSLNCAYMAEQFIEGRELTVGVLEGNGEAMPLVASEVLLNSGHSFDYDGKYLGKGTTEVTPANLSKEQMKDAQELAIKAHQVLGCRGYSRTDMILTKQGLVFLETNTLPGLTKASFIPQQLAAVGISMRKFVEDQIAIALSR